MNDLSKKFLAVPLVITAFFLSATNVLADTAFTPWIPAHSFTSFQSIQNQGNAVDGNAGSYATLEDPTGMVGFWQFENGDVTLPSGSTIDSYELKFHTSNNFFQLGCNHITNLNKTDNSDGMSVPLLSSFDGDDYSTTDITISPTQNATLWNASMFDVNDFSTWKLVRGIGGECSVVGPRNFNEAFIRVNYTYTPVPSPIPSPVPTPEPSPELSPTPVPSPIPSPIPSPMPSPVPSPSVVPTPIPSPVPTPVPTPVPSPSPSVSPSPVATPHPTPSPVPTPHPTPSPSPTPTPTTTPPWWWPWWLPWNPPSSPTPSPVPTPRPTPSPSPKVSPKPTPKPTPSPSPKPGSGGVCR